MIERQQFLEMKKEFDRLKLMQEAQRHQEHIENTKQNANSLLLQRVNSVL